MSGTFLAEWVICRQGGPCLRRCQNAFEEFQRRSSATVYSASLSHLVKGSHAAVSCLSSQKGT
ncbi:hypothetical protein RB8749 [Rhodopirellula baltica SH 1]|uniref:Uncharacterized protein n=1 Tax=Rhodopirellula baltica (strain DSM 10527 / NCIMB 13988 / SH1) TaxID=243090 RepID=Q7UML6_RHOBA|nr:hypothetical protein RB8749 [Rhodopirellula baltica SH 1]